MSASSTLSVIAPQFDSVANRSDFITLATLHVNACLTDEKYDLAVAYLAAHMIALNTDSAIQQGETGNLTSKREGDLSVGYGNFSNKGMLNLNLTIYGQQYENLLRSTGIGFYVLNSGVSCED